MPIGTPIVSRESWKSASLPQAGTAFVHLFFPTLSSLALLSLDFLFSGPPLTSSLIVQPSHSPLYKVTIIYGTLFTC